MTPCASEQNQSNINGKQWRIAHLHEHLHRLGGQQQQALVHEVLKLFSDVTHLANQLFLAQKQHTTIQNSIKRNKTA